MGFECVLVDEAVGTVVVMFSGASARELFANESGGHRYQRVPPTERRGRVHTSTVTVAVLDPEAACEPLAPSEVLIRTARGSGPGGQHRNKTESCVTATHVPTGISARIDLKSQHQSRAVALRVLAAKIAEMRANGSATDRNDSRRRQVGSGMRGDKVRTYREQDDRVSDHRSGRSWSLEQWRRGRW